MVERFWRYVNHFNVILCLQFRELRSYLHLGGIVWKFNFHPRFYRILIIFKQIIGGTLTGTNIQGQSGAGSNGNEGVLLTLIGVLLFCKGQSILIPVDTIKQEFAVSKFNLPTIDW